MTVSIITADIVGAIVILILTYALFTANDRTDKKVGIFTHLCIASFIEVILDAISYMSLNWSKYGELRNIISGLTFIIPFYLISVFLSYCYYKFKPIANISKKVFDIGIVYCIIQSIIGIVTSCLGILFYFEDNVYKPGIYYPIYIASFGLIFIYTIALIVSQAKAIHFKKVLSVIMFLVFPSIAVFINLLNEDMAFIAPSISFSLLFIYITLQVETQDELIADNMSSIKLLNTDQLTDLGNRNAYNDRCRNCNIAGHEVGVLYADLNGLKYTNDTFGHNAGDKLLKDFANLLISYFRKNDIFRISGDEFIVIMPRIPVEVFNRKTAELKETISKMEMPIASVGFAYGTQENLMTLVNTAEENMYLDKKEFHSKYPKYNRESVKEDD